ncbi:MAG: 2-amino-4-hydroxy-6-hydroxymethyldihydropteridine diphosphokinase [Prevotella sp.]|nr:2-amino-4-hydroxy-6-hydroxymethyldihydropteridine diphosphokinase [Prevotella sp.]
MKTFQVILSVGSNTFQEKNVAKAKEILKKLLHDAVFSESIWTEPEGLQSDRFLNCLAAGSTVLTLEKLQTKLKQIEIELGDAPENHRNGIVNIDIDTLQYGHRRLKEKDWKRSYVQKLIKQIQQ